MTWLGIVLIAAGCLIVVTTLCSLTGRFIAHGSADEPIYP